MLSYLQTNLFKILALLVLSFLPFITPFAVEAAPTYAVTPLVIDEDVEPRDIIQKVITITNTGTQPVTVFPSVNNISLDSGGGIQEFFPPVMSDQTSSLASWIEISRAGIDIRVGETKTVTLTLHINPNPKEGEYHAFVGFGNGRNRDEAEAMVARGDAPGTVVTVNFAEKKTSLLKLSRFLVDRFITSAENNGAAYVITNPGDEALVPSGEIIFYDKRGVEVASLPVNPDKVAINSRGEHTFDVTVPSDGLFGKYKAFLSVEYGTAQLASVQDTAFFYVLPLRATLIGIGIFLTIIVLISLYVHRRYFDDDVKDGSELLPVHIRDTASNPLHHDIDLRKP